MWVSVRLCRLASKHFNRSNESRKVEHAMIPTNTPTSMGVHQIMVLYIYLKFTLPTNYCLSSHNNHPQNNQGTSRANPANKHNEKKTAKVLTITVRLQIIDVLQLLNSHDSHVWLPCVMVINDRANHQLSCSDSVTWFIRSVGILDFLW